MTPEEQFTKTCRGEFDEIKDMIKVMHDKMFVGNGTPSHSVQLDRLNRFMRGMLWFICTTYSIWAVIMAKLIYETLKK